MPRRNHGPRLKWLKKRNCFYVVWTEGGRSREHSTGERNLEEAQIYLAKFIQKHRAPGAPRDISKVQINEVLANYAEARAKKIKAPERIGYALPPLSQFWAGATVSTINEDACDKYVLWRNLAPATINREFGVLSAAIKYAHQNGHISQTVKIKKLPTPKSKYRWLSKSELVRLLWNARNCIGAKRHLQQFILLGFRTGRRKEAILSLRWDQVNLERGYIEWLLDGEVETAKGKPKSKIQRKLLAYLKILRRRNPLATYVIELKGKRIGNPRNSFNSACKAAGFDDVTPHTLRHTAATWLMQKGGPVPPICGFLGMSRETLENVYGHHHPDFQDGPANAY